MGKLTPTEQLASLMPLSLPTNPSEWLAKAPNAARARAEPAPTDACTADAASAELPPAAPPAGPASDTQSGDGDDDSFRPRAMKHPWTAEEDSLLSRLIEEHGASKWSTIAQFFEDRAGKQCRERWVQHLQPCVVKGAWTEEEDRVIMAEVEAQGKRWNVIAHKLPGRTDNAIKNRWNSTKRKELKQQQRLEQGRALLAKGILPKSKLLKGALLPRQTPCANRPTTPADLQSPLADTAKENAEMPPELELEQPELQGAPPSRKRKRPAAGAREVADMDRMIREVSSKLAAAKPQSRERKKYWHKIEMLMLIDLTRQAEALVDGRDVDLYTELSSDFETEAESGSGGARAGGREELVHDLLLSTPRARAGGARFAAGRSAGAPGDAGAAGGWMAPSMKAITVDIGGGLDFGTGLQMPSHLQPSPFEARKLFPLSPSSPHAQLQPEPRPSSGLASVQSALAAVPALEASAGAKEPQDEFWANILEYSGC